MMSSANYTVYYGIDYVKYFIHHIPQLILFGSVDAIIPGIMIVFTLLVCIAIFISGFFKKRNELVFYVPFLVALAFGSAALHGMLFGIKLYDGTVAYNYFQLFALNAQAPLMPKVFFIVLFVDYLLTVIFTFLLILFIFVAPARTDKYLAKQYEKEFATIREVRQVSNEEIAKYIKEHANEVREALGLANNAAQVAPIVNEEANSEQHSSEEIALEIAKAVAAQNPNTEPGTTTHIIVEANGVKQEVEVKPEENNEKPAEEAKVEEKPAEEKKTPASKSSLFKKKDKQEKSES